LQAAHSYITSTGSLFSLEAPPPRARIFSYLIAYLNRSNISVAALQMNADLGLSAQMYGLGAGLF
jgi:hypothetical protein